MFQTYAYHPCIHEHDFHFKEINSKQKHLCLLFYVSLLKPCATCFEKSHDNHSVLFRIQTQMISKTEQSLKAKYEIKPIICQISHLIKAWFYFYFQKTPSVF